MFKKLLIIFSAVLLAAPPLAGGLTGELPLCIFYAAAFAILAFAVLPLTADKKSIVLSSQLDLALPLFAAVYLPAVITAASRYSAANEVIKYLSFFAVYITIRYVASEKKNVPVLLRAVAASALAAAVIGIVKSVIITALPVSSALQSNHAFGLYCSVGILICFGESVDTDSRLKKILLTAASCVMMFGLLLSCSHISLIMMLIGLICTCVFKKDRSFKYLGINVIAYAAVGVLVLTGSSDVRSFWLSNPFASQGFAEWLAFWRDGFDAVKASWLTGHGGGGWSVIYPTFQSFTYATSRPHNFIMQTFIESGALGLCVLAAFVYVFFKSVKAAIRENPLICIILSMILLHSLLCMTFQVTAVAAVFWGLLAVPAAYSPAKDLKIKVQAGRIVAFSIILFIVSGMLLLNYNSKTVAQKYLEKENFAKAAPMYRQAMFFNYYDDTSRLNYLYANSMYLGTDSSVDSTEVYEFAGRFNNSLANIVSSNKKNIGTLKMCQDLYRQTYNTDMAISLAEYIVDIDPLDPESYQMLAEAYVNKVLVLSQQDNPDIETIRTLYSYVVTIPELIVKNTQDKNEEVNPTHVTLQLIGASATELAKLQ